MTLIEKLRLRGAEFARALANGHYDRTPGGIFLRKAKIHIGGVMSYQIDQLPWVLANNTATFEGLDDILSVYFAGGAQKTAFYFVPYSGNVVPDGNVKASNFNATLTEFTNYSAGARVQWTPGAVAGQSVDNTATTAQLVIGAGGGTVRGAGLSSASAKLASTGVLPVVAPFTDPAVLNANSKLNLEYTLSAQDA